MRLNAKETDDCENLHNSKYLNCINNERLRHRGSGDNVLEINKTQNKTSPNKPARARRYILIT